MVSRLAACSLVPLSACSLDIAWPPLFKFHFSQNVIIVLFGLEFLQHFRTAHKCFLWRMFIREELGGLSDNFLSSFCLFAASKQTISFYNKDTRGELQRATFDRPELKKIFHGSFHKVNAAALMLYVELCMRIDMGCGTPVKDVSSHVQLYMCSMTWGYTDV